MSRKGFEGGDINSLLNNRNEFYNTLVSTVWEITNYEPEPGNVTIFGTGFCINKRGVLMTCAHNIQYEEETIEVRNMRPNGEVIVGEADVLSICRTWDVALLKVRLPKPDEIESFDFVTFVDDGERVYCGEEVHSIGTIPELPWTFLSGRVVYPFAGYNHRFESSDFRDLEKSFTHDASFDRAWKSFRVMGDYINNRGPESKGKYNIMHSRIPVIQISNALTKPGCSGSPLFDNKGRVIGMLFMHQGNHTLAIHFKALKYYKDFVVMKDIMKSAAEGGSEKIKAEDCSEKKRRAEGSSHKKKKKRN